MARTKRKSTAKPTAPYVPTERERAAIAASDARLRGKRPAPKLTVTQGKSGLTVGIHHTDLAVGSKLILESLGLADGHAYAGLMRQLMDAATQGQKPDAEAVNAFLGMVQGIEPKDTIEAMLAVQMVAVHSATMKLARTLKHVETIPQQDSASNAFNKLARTFTMQLDAMNRHRGKGQQAIRVEHVTVNGGQAVVGSNVYPQGGGSSNFSAVQPHAKQILRE